MLLPVSRGIFVFSPWEMLAVTKLPLIDIEFGLNT